MRNSIVAVLAIVPLVVTGCALATKAPPVANAGPDLTARVAEMMSFDGSQSVDLDGGQIVYYRWYVIRTPEGREDEVGRVLREGEDAAIWTSDQPMAEEDVGQWIIELKVTDDEGQQATDDMMLTVIR